MHVTFLAALALLFAVAFGQSIWQWSPLLQSDIPTSHSLALKRIYGLKDVEVTVLLGSVPNLADLEISLTHQPSGKRVQLLHQQCDGVQTDAHHGLKLILSDTKDDSNCNVVEFQLNIAPYGQLSLFNGLSGAVHTFTLSVKDVNGAVNGRLNGWRLALNVDKYAPVGILTTWDGARQWCADFYTTDLAVIKSNDDISDSKRICKKQCDAMEVSPLPLISFNNCNGCWMGLSRDTESTFKWVDGTALTSNSPTNWGSVEPSNSNGNEDCVQMRIDEYRWNDRPCSDAWDVPLCTNPSSREFEAIASEETWENARTKCRDNLGKDLAVFETGPNADDDRDDIEFGKKICRETCDRFSWCLGCWIGFHDRNHEGTFEWILKAGSDTSIRPTSATDWNSGEPNNYLGRDEDCAEIHKEANYKWNDAPCDSSGYIPLCHRKSFY